jgi:TPR repeat protein
VSRFVALSYAFALFGKPFLMLQTPMKVRAATLALVLMPVATFGQDFAAGLAAAQRGDFTTALQEWQPLAEAGSSTAQYNLAIMYANGEGVPQDDGEAARWYRLAAEQGSVAAQLSLGFIYEAGKGVPRDGLEAIRWYRMAAEQGSAAAQLNLGFMYDEGQDILRDPAEAVRWYRLAAEQGNAAAQLNLGYMYRNGEGVPQDDTEAVRWYRLAAEQGNAAAQSNLGFMYRNGQGVTQDNTQAMRWYRLAADQGNAAAQLNIGLMYREGAGVPEDDAEAARWYRLAAEQGMPSAQSGLGFLYEQGLGVPRDDVEAIRLYRLAAEQGDAFAQARLETPESGDVPIGAAVQQEASTNNPDAPSRGLSIPTWNTLETSWLASISISLLLLLALIWVTITSRRSFRTILDEIAPMQQQIEQLRQRVYGQDSWQPAAPQIEQSNVKLIEQQLTITAPLLEPSVDHDEPDPEVSPAAMVPPTEDPEYDLVPLPATKDEDTPPPSESHDFIRALDFPQDEHGLAAMRRAMRDDRILKLLQASHDVLTLLSHDDIYVDDLPSHPISAGSWRRMAQGKVDYAIDSMHPTRNLEMYAVIKDRLHDDAAFRDAVQLLMLSFEQVLGIFETDLTDTNLLDMGETRIARAFMLLTDAWAVSLMNDNNDEKQNLTDQDTTDGCSLYSLTPSGSLNFVPVAKDTPRITGS